MDVTVVVVGAARSISEAVEAAAGLGIAIDALIIAGAVPPEKDALAPGFEVYANCLGLKEIKGLKIVFLGLDDMAGDGAGDGAGDSSFERLESPVDVLVSPTPDTVVGPGSKAARDLALKLSPWYHFSAGKYYESEPFYVNGRGTRLVQLDNVNGASKWFHVVRIGPGVRPATAVSGVNFYEPSLTHANDIVWGRPSFPEDKADIERQPKRQKRPCFMCLGETPDDLTVKVGESMYLTTAKGPIYSPEARKVLGCSGHVLLIPREHIPSVFLSESVPDEHQKILDQVTATYDRLGLVPFIYEFARAATIHGHTQIVPVPADKMAAVLTLLKDQAAARNLQILDNVPDGDYLMVRAGKTMYIPLPPKIDLQLPRRILCDALGVPEQEAWQKSVLKNEREDAQRFGELLGSTNS